jgi:TPR repeat protein
MKTLLACLVFLAALLPVQAGIPFFPYLLQTAIAGEAESQFILGIAYRDGWDGTIKTGSAMAKWHNLALELGDQRPNLLLRRLLQQQIHITQDNVVAKKWLGLAADQGDDYARVILGEMLLEGDGVPADWVSGAEWIRKSAAAGFSPAQLRMGLVYLIGGQSTPKDDIEALAWLIVAAESGSKVAIEIRDEQTHLLGREVASLAVKRSRALRTHSGTAARSSEQHEPSEHAKS